jgi:hypothetical protein
MNRPLTSLMVLLLLPATGWAQAPEERIDAALAHAEEIGIPAGLLESKLAEGRAKGVPMERIAIAVQNRLEALTRAREIMARGANDLDAAQISVGADALGAGVDADVLTELAATTSAERRAVAVAALSYLGEQERFADQGRALEAIQNALARGPGGLRGIPGFAGPPAGLPTPEGVGPPDGRPQTGPPAGVPAPGRRGPPDRPRGPPGGGI